MRGILSFSDGQPAAAGQRTVETFYFCRLAMCRDWKRLLFHGLHLTFLCSHDTTFKQGIKPLISVNSTPSGQFWRPFWYEWGISSARQCPQFPIVLMTNGLLWWWLLFWIIAFHVLGVVCISGFLITRLPDYPNCHNCIAMGRLLHAGLINLINISRQGTHANQRIIFFGKNKEIFVRSENYLYAQLPFLWVSVAVDGSAKSKF